MTLELEVFPGLLAAGIPIDFVRLPLGYLAEALRRRKKVFCFQIAAPRQ